jgi:ribonuclease HI
MQASIHIDGGSRGNPGPASYAVVLERAGLEPIEECDTIGKTTNNIAEYTALVRALELAKIHALKTLHIYSDSELLVKQMKGEYKVKNEDLREWFDQAKELVKQFEKVTIIHVRREQNKRADQLCNMALDGDPRPRGDSAAVSVPVAKPESVDEIGKRLLGTLLHSDASPTHVDEVWKQIKALFQK